jgi:hypothetical protein
VRASGASRRRTSRLPGKTCSSWLLASWLVATADLAQAENAQDLLLTLSNPISGLGRVSADFDEDRNINEGEHGTLHSIALHPIFPVDLGNRFRLISDGVLSSTDTQSSSNSSFQETLTLSPVQPQANGFRWAAGTTVRFEGEGKWGVGPAVTLLQEDGNEVSGLVLAHVWSASDDNGDLSTLDAFTTWTRKGTGLTFRVQASYDERSGEMLVPVGLGVRRVFNTPSFGVALDLRARYYLDVPTNAGRWGAGVGLTLTRRFDE